MQRAIAASLNFFEHMLPTGSSEELALIDRIKTDSCQSEDLSTDQLNLLMTMRLLSSSTLERSCRESDRLNWVAAARYVELLSLENEITIDDLLRIHGLIFGSEDVIGLRSVDVHAGAHHFSSYKRVHLLLRDFLSLLGAIDSPISRAAFAYQGICSIHPFEDGNGRVARLVADHFLVSSGAMHLAFPDTTFGLVVSRRDKVIRHRDVLESFLGSSRYIMRLIA